jgi:hypothetical protein
MNHKFDETRGKPMFTILKVFEVKVTDINAIYVLRHKPLVGTTHSF